MSKLPAGQYEPEVLREMTIPEMDIPEFKPHIKEDDIGDFSNRDKKVLLALSVIEQSLAHGLRWAQIHNRALREMEAELIRARLRQNEINWKFAAMKWFAVTLGAGVIAAVARKIFG